MSVVGMYMGGGQSNVKAACGLDFYVMSTAISILDFYSSRTRRPVGDR